MVELNSAELWKQNKKEKQKKMTGKLVFLI